MTSRTRAAVTAVLTAGVRPQAAPATDPQTRRRSRVARHHTGTHFVVGSVVALLALAATYAVAPNAAPSSADILAAYNEEHAQSISVDSTAAAATIVRGEYSATAGYNTLAAEGTNHAWAKMVLLAGDFPMTDDNVTVLLRWMRQENGADNWWNRNNPLNNGWGSGGGGGTGTYDSLITAAKKAAEALRKNGGYSGIVAALDASSPTAVTESAIWASPWASGHYANGGHWHYTEVPVVTAPASAWQ